MEKQSRPDFDEIRGEISRTRKTILDLLEMAFGDHPRWPMARTAVLRTLGKSGLEGVVDAAEDREAGVHVRREYAVD